MHMSEHTDATEDRDDEPDDLGGDDEPDTDDDGPQPWAKAVPGDGD
jgi:hypothetical protein